MNEIQDAEPFLMGYLMPSGSVEFHTLSPSEKSRLSKLWQEETTDSPVTLLTGSQIFSLIDQAMELVTKELMVEIWDEAFEDGGRESKLIALRGVKDATAHAVRKVISDATQS